MHIQELKSVFLLSRTRLGYEREKRETRRRNDLAGMLGRTQTTAMLPP